MTLAALTPQTSKAELRKTMKRIRVLIRQKRLKDAKPLCDLLYAHGVRNVEFLHTYGLTLRASEDLNGALVKVYAAHEKEPEDAKILNSLGLIFQDMKDTETAIAMFKRATSKDQKYYDAWQNLGISLRIAERYDAAELAFSCAYQIDDSRPEPLLNIAFIQADLRRYARAAELMDEILKNHENVTAGMRLRRLQIAMRLEDLDYVKEHMDRVDGSALDLLEQTQLDGIRAQCHVIHEQLDEAIAIIEEALIKRGRRQYDLITQLGYCYSLAGRVEDGIVALKNVLKDCPDHHSARYGLALLQFKNGEAAAGFENYEARWQVKSFSSARRKFDVPRWRGEPIEGKSILVWREQGVGDEIRYASLLPELREAGCSVTFECTQKLIPLWEASFPWAIIRQEGGEHCINDTNYTGFDYQIPVGSLGSIYRKTVADFSKRQKPWIVRNRDAESQIRRQLAIQPDELLVGICWRSMNQVASRAKLFLNCEQLEVFRDLPNVRWINVQYSSTDEEVQTIRTRGLDLHHYVDLDQKDDLVGACNVIGACDLVISVGGSIGDLAGGLGTPLVYMNRELSEGFLGTDHVPWFVNCKSYPIVPYKVDKTAKRIVEDWCSIAEWAEGLKPADRKSNVFSTMTAAPLDLEYPIAAVGRGINAQSSHGSGTSDACDC